MLDCLLKYCCNYMPLTETVIKQNSKIKIALSLININEYFGGNLRSRDSLL